MSDAPSRNAVKKAASTIRKHGRGEASDEDLEAALVVVRAYRQMFYTPLVKVNNGLRKFARALDIEAEVSQRLKKIPTIEGKLKFEKTLDFYRMQDIGGCRAVVEDIAAVRAMEARIRRTWGDQIRDDADYIENPRRSGYRSLHIIVERDQRLIEIQIRTKIMHDWALTVEAFNGALGENFKRDGDHIIQRYMQVVSEAMHARETQQPISPELLDRLNRMRDEVQTYLDSRP